MNNSNTLEVKKINDNDICNYIETKKNDIGGKRNDKKKILNELIIYESNSNKFFLSKTLKNVNVDKKKSCSEKDYSKLSKLHFKNKIWCSKLMMYKNLFNNFEIPFIGFYNKNPSEFIENNVKKKSHLLMPKFFKNYYKFELCFKKFSYGYYFKTILDQHDFNNQLTKCISSISDSTDDINYEKKITYKKLKKFFLYIYRKNFVKSHKTEVLNNYEKKKNVFFLKKMFKRSISANENFNIKKLFKSKKKHVFKFENEKDISFLQAHKDLINIEMERLILISH